MLVTGGGIHIPLPGIRDIKINVPSVTAMPKHGGGFVDPASTPDRGQFVHGEFSPTSARSARRVQGMGQGQGQGGKGKGRSAMPSPGGMPYRGQFTSPSPPTSPGTAVVWRPVQRPLLAPPVASHVIIHDALLPQL
jgi:hypothetical protein